jgi:hypothetical protein
MMGGAGGSSDNAQLSEIKRMMEEMENLKK